jgi:hypothetical protein
MFLYYKKQVYITSKALYISLLLRLNGIIVLYKRFKHCKMDAQPLWIYCSMGDPDDFAYILWTMQSASASIISSMPRQQQNVVLVSGWA